MYQIVENVPREDLFSEYLYRSSYSDSMQQHVIALVGRLTAERGLTGSSLVMEVASNDGYLLKHYVARGIPVLGIEPAANIAAIAEAENRVRTEVRFLDTQSAPEIVGKYGRADVIHGHNVFAHTPQPVDFLKSVAMLLAPSGIAVIEAPYVLDLIQSCAFDTIYHEHYSYLSAEAVQNMLAQAGLSLVAIERTPIHGGSVIYFLAHEGTEVSPGVRAFLDEEARIGLGTEAYATSFSNRVENLCAKFSDYLTTLSKEGKSIAAYGASAKGSTFLNKIGGPASLIEFVVDRSTLKQGRFMPGVGIPILPVEALLERQPDVTVLLSWNFRDEILRQQSKYFRRGGCFLVPVPDPELVREAPRLN